MLNYTDFGGKFGPPEADEVKKCAKMRANAHERYLAGPKMNADRWLIEECWAAGKQYPVERC